MIILFRSAAPATAGEAFNEVVEAVADAAGACPHRATNRFAAPVAFDADNAKTRDAKREENAEKDTENDHYGDVCTSFLITI